MPRSRGALAFWLTVWALCWSALVLAAGFWADVYSGETQTSDGSVAHTSGTLVSVNGLDAAVLLALPLALSLVAAFGLHRRCSRGSVRGAAVAWFAVALIGTLAVAGAASIGVLVLPVALLLGAAARLTPAA